MSKSGQTNTGEGAEYTSPEEAELEVATEKAFIDRFGEKLLDAPLNDRSSGAMGTSGMVVTAQVEWAGSTQRSNDGMRTVRLDGVELTNVQQALHESRQARQRARDARPATSYQAKGWHAQIRALTQSKRGGELATEAGLNVTARTLQAWLAEDRAPSKRNRQLIADAYAGLGIYGVQRAAGESRQATSRTAEALTAAIGERYGATVRFRDIRGFTFEP